MSLNWETRPELVVQQLNKINEQLKQPFINQTKYNHEERLIGRSSGLQSPFYCVYPNFGLNINLQTKDVSQCSSFDHDTNPSYSL